MAKEPRDKEYTVRSVLRYAQLLRERAQRARVRDPYAEPYTITDAAARKVSQEHGPLEALSVIAARAYAHERDQREAEARSTRAFAELRVHQQIEKGERKARLEGLTLPSRLAEALAAAATFSEVRASRLDSDIVTGSKAHDVFLGRRELECEAATAEVERAVCKLERLVQSTRRRMIEEQAA